MMRFKKLHIFHEKANPMIEIFENKILFLLTKRVNTVVVNNYFSKASSQQITCPSEKETADGGKKEMTPERKENRVKGIPVMG